MQAKVLLLVAGLILAAQVSSVSGETRVVDPNTSQVASWNRFVDKLYELHQRQVARAGKVRQSERVGGYHRLPGFYREVSYFDESDGRLLGLIRWERAQPKRIHSIDVNVYDAAGRVIRDYSATYLPEGRNSPYQTLVNLHHYVAELHAFRQFDASGNRLYEDCKGTSAGKPVAIGLDIFALIQEEGKRDGVLESPVYNECFGNLATTAGEYLNPQ